MKIKQHVIVLLQLKLAKRVFKSMSIKRRCCFAFKSFLRTTHLPDDARKTERNVLDNCAILVQFTFLMDQLVLEAMEQILSCFQKCYLFITNINCKQRPLKESYRERKFLTCREFILKNDSQTCFYLLAGCEVISENN